MYLKYNYMSHNLNIQEYSYSELLGMFDLPENMSPEQLKGAKRKVLMMHPDKSKLDPKYFLFYKKAYEIIIYMHSNLCNINKPVENVEYHVPENTDNKLKLQSISSTDFHSKFNDLYDKHMKKEIDTSKNDWFRNEESLYLHNVNSIGQMNQEINNIKTAQQQHQITHYRGVVPMQMSGGNQLYDDDTSSDYVTSDIFSKLKYDDLRKVHKDQTVFSVKDSDISNIKQYNSVDEYERARSVNNLTPMEKNQAQNMIYEQEQELQKRIRKQQYKQELNTLQYKEKNKEIMSNFMLLHNS